MTDTELQNMMKSLHMTKVNQAETALERSAIDAAIAALLQIEMRLSSKG